VVLLKRRSGRQTSSRRWRFSRKFDWIVQVQVIPQHAIKAMRVLSTKKMVIGRQQLRSGMALFTTTSDLHGGALWSGSGELQEAQSSKLVGSKGQGSILHNLHELIPTGEGQKAGFAIRQCRAPGNNPGGGWPWAMGSCLALPSHPRPAVMALAGVLPGAARCWRGMKFAGEWTQ
jgi:hypothetical protein